MDYGDNNNNNGNPPISAEFRNKYLKKKQLVLSNEQRSELGVAQVLDRYSLANELNQLAVDRSKLSNDVQRYVDSLLLHLENQWQAFADTALGFAVGLPAKKQFRMDALEMAVSNMAEMHEMRLQNLRDPASLHCNILSKAADYDAATKTREIQAELEKIEEQRVKAISEANRAQQKKKTDLSRASASCGSEQELRNKQFLERESTKAELTDYYNSRVCDMDSDDELEDFEEEWKLMWQSTFNQLSSKQNRELAELKKREKIIEGASKTFESALNDAKQHAQIETKRLTNLKSEIVSQSKIELSKQLDRVSKIYAKNNIKDQYSQTPPLPTTTPSSSATPTTSSSTQTPTQTQTPTPVVTTQKKDNKSNSISNNNKPTTTTSTSTTSITSTSSQNLKGKIEKVDNNSKKNNKGKVEEVTVVEKVDTKVVEIKKVDKDEATVTVEKITQSIKSIQLKEDNVAAAKIELGAHHPLSMHRRKMADITKKLASINNSMKELNNGNHIPTMTALKKTQDADVTEQMKLAKQFGKLQKKKKSLTLKLQSATEKEQLLVFFYERSFIPLVIPSPSFFAQLSKDSVNLFEALGCKEKKRGERLLAHVGDMLSKSFRGFNPELFLFGSSSNGLAFQNSDLDISLVTSKPLDQAKATFKIADLLRKSNYKEVQAITRTRVPIVKFKDEHNNLSCDLSINNPLAIYNSKMIYDYCSLDSRIRPMALVIKKWSKVRGINDASKHSLHSYSYANMIIHYLQKDNIQILPSLQQLANGIPHFVKGKKFVGKMLPDAMVDGKNVKYFKNFESLSHFSAHNTMTLGELVLGFFKYYSIEFNFENTISIRTGGLLTQKVWEDQTREYFIKIEDPFDTGFNMARSVRKIHHLSLIVKEFYRAYQILSQGGSLNDLIQPHTNTATSIPESHTPHP